MQGDVDIPSEDAALEGDVERIGPGDRLVELAVAIDADQRAEDLELRDLGVDGRVEQHGRLQRRLRQPLAAERELGAALQAGVDIPLGDKAMGFSIDVKRYFVDTTARFHAGDRLVLETEHELNPWVASAGLTWRF